MNFRLLVVFSSTTLCGMFTVNEFEASGYTHLIEVGIDKFVANGEYSNRNLARNGTDCSILAPQGIIHYADVDTSFNELVNAIEREEDIRRKEHLFHNLLKEFPENSISREESYIRIRTSLALSWATKGNVQKVKSYYELIKGRVTTAHPLALAINLVKHKEMHEAVKILYDIRQQVADESTANAGKLYVFLRTYTTLAEALHYLKRDEEALIYIEEAYLKSDRKRESINSVYGTILNKLNKHSLAMPIMEDLVSSGMASTEIKRLLEESYIAVYGSSIGFVKLMDSLNAQLRLNMNKVADARSLAIPAFDFALKNLEGQTVSLSSLRGKIVVLDFWATWCVPCIKSLPAMQITVNHFSNDPDVVFLFINTNEEIPDRKEKVKEFLKEKGYDLHILLDEKQPGRTEFIAATGYKVRGIPAKFIIDNNGIIRYKMTGFNGGTDATVAELIAMINAIKE